MNNRYLSLDIFRGATVALMILVNNPGSFSHIFWPLDHAEWNGCTLTDLVFPFFLFAVGNAAAFVIPKFRDKGDVVFLKKVMTRSIIIFLIGLFLNWSPFVKWENDEIIFKSWETVRILGVLQRIAICYLLGSILIYYLSEKQLIFTSISLLLFYWFLCYFFGNAADPFSLNGYFGTKADVFLLGENHLYKGEGIAFDPEGFMSSISATIEVILGYLAGSFILKKGKTFEMLSQLFYAGTVLILIGICWSLFFPLNKKIWSSSYTVYTSGIALLTICCLIYLIEFKNTKSIWITFFDVFGKNALFIFFLSGLIPRVLGLIRIPQIDLNGRLVYINPLKWIYENWFEHLATDLRIGSMCFAIFLIFCFWLIGFFLYKRKIYIKI